MKIITLNEKNIASEHVCCSLADKKGETGVLTKKAWLTERFKEGLVFKKADVRGKVFIEYIPAEKAWVPIEADGYMFINCFWVAGQYKGQGIGTRLLEECIQDAKNQNKKGLAVISSDKKKPYLSDPKFLKYKGFKLGDTASPYYELLYLPLDKGAVIPKFKQCAKQSKETKGEGIVIYYSHQCPFTEKYTSILEKAAQDRGLKFMTKRYTNAKEAQNALVPSTTYSLFIDGVFITHEILTEDRLMKLLERY